MFRTGFIVSIALCLVLPGSPRAQQAFPPPSTELHDVKFKFTDPHTTAEVRFEVATGRTVVVPRTPTQIDSLAFSREGKLLAVGKEYGRLVVWDILSEKIVCTIDTGFNSVKRVAISPDNQFIAAAAASGPTIKIWHFPDGRLANTFENVTANVLGLIYAPSPNLLITLSAATNVYDTASGERVRSFPDERDPVLSTDGSTLLTTNSSSIIFRSTSDWTIQKKLPRLTDFERPVFLDLAEGLFLFEDMTDDHVFVAAQTSDGQTLPEEKLANLPGSKRGLSDFAAIYPHTSLVFGHSSGQLWALDLKTGRTCLSAQLFSDSGALSPDGNLLAGAFEPETPTDDQKKAGVGLWKTDSLAKSCFQQ